MQPTNNQEIEPIAASAPRAAESPSMSTGSSAGPPLLSLPTEVLHQILVDSGNLDPTSVAALARTCRDMCELIDESIALWRDLFLSTYDDPRRAAAYPTPRGTDWRQEFQDRAWVQRALTWGEERYGELECDVDRIANTLISLYLDLPADADPDSEDPFAFFAGRTHNAPILTRLLYGKPLRHLYLHTQTSRLEGGHNLRRKNGLHPGLSRLHCLMTTELDDDHGRIGVYRKVLRNHRGLMRETCYSARNFKSRNDWGPFTPQGTVEWGLLNALSTVMMLNAVDVLDLEDEGSAWLRTPPPIGTGLCAVRSQGFLNHARPSDLPDDQVWDWAGVAGPWAGTYAYLDYADWLRLNHPGMLAMESSLPRLDLTTYGEAVGDLINLYAVVDKGPEEADASCSAVEGEDVILPRIETALETSDLYPPLYFHSEQRLTGHMAQRGFIRGVARVTPDDPPQIRWTIIIRYGGEDRWRMEGVQVGGRGSKRGFFGTWTDAAKELYSPNGPVWFWHL